MTYNEQAVEKYLNVHEEIKAEFIKLHTHILNHLINHPIDNINWAHVGDMQYILSELRKLNREGE